MNGEAAGVALADDRAEDLGVARLPLLFDAHHERLYRLARRLSPTAEEARDLVQETFLRVVKSPGAIPAGSSSEEAWLVRILINLCRDQWRRRAARRRLDAHHQTGTWAAASPDIESALIARTAVWRALETLPPRQRAAIVLYELEGVGIPGIAQLLGVSQVTVRWHLSRGRRELARIIISHETSHERGPS
jgi:RNA polymerase sigma-70 factor (ECF subfamily)